MESDRGRGRSEQTADAKQMLVGSQGEVGLLFMQCFDRQAPHLTEPHCSRAERGADQVAATVFLHGKLGTL